MWSSMFTSFRGLSNALKEEQLRIFAACATTPSSQRMLPPRFLNHSSCLIFYFRIRYVRRFYAYPCSPFPSHDLCSVWFTERCPESCDRCYSPLFLQIGSLSWVGRFESKAWLVLFLFTALGTIANDLGNAKRALTTGENNSYTFWLKMTVRCFTQTFSPASFSKRASNMMIQLLSSFWMRPSVLIRSWGTDIPLPQLTPIILFREKLLRDKEQVSFYDMSTFLDNIPVVQRYYAISEIMRSAKL